MRAARDVRAILAAIAVFAVLAVACFLCFLLAPRGGRAQSFLEWSAIALGMLAPLASGGIHGYIAQRHELSGAVFLGVANSGIVLVLGAVGDRLGIPRDHIGMLWEIIGVAFFCIALAVVGGAIGGKLQSGRYA